MKNGRRKLTKICGARNRRGLPCQCKLLLAGGKCKFHGGMSTGPRTSEGRAKALAQLKQYREGKLPIPDTPPRSIRVQVVQCRLVLIPQQRDKGKGIDRAINKLATGALKRLSEDAG